MTDRRPPAEDAHAKAVELARQIMVAAVSTDSELARKTITWAVDEASALPLGVCMVVAEIASCARVALLLAAKPRGVAVWHVLEEIWKAMAHEDRSSRQEDV